MPLSARRRLHRLAWMLAGLLVVVAVEARHRAARMDVAGVFDYYVLSLSWSPAYCQSAPAAEECRGPRRHGFIVHGLWPQDERGWPEHCATSARLPDSVVSGIADLMPAPSLVRHEWEAHGECSGLQPAEYFDLVRRARESLRIPAPLRDPQRVAQQSPTAIAAAFLGANAGLPADALVVTCSRHGQPRLREVRICLNRDLSARACSAQARHAACRAPQVLIAPVR